MSGSLKEMNRTTQKSSSPRAERDSGGIRTHTIVFVKSKWTSRNGKRLSGKE